MFGAIIGLVIDAMAGGVYKAHSDTRGGFDIAGCPRPAQLAGRPEGDELERLLRSKPPSPDTEETLGTVMYGGFDIAVYRGGTEKEKE